MCPWPVTWLSNVLSLSELPWEITSSLYPPSRGLWRRGWHAACEALSGAWHRGWTQNTWAAWSVSSTAAALPGRVQWTRLHPLVRGRGGACISFSAFSPRALSTYPQLRLVFHPGFRSTFVRDWFMWSSPQLLLSFIPTSRSGNCTWCQMKSRWDRVCKPVREIPLVFH